MAKRFTATLTRDGRPNLRAKFVVPALDGTPQFVELETGRPRDRAYIVYTGADITVEDILDRLPAPVDSEKACALMTMFLDQLQLFKLGNVLSVKEGGENLRLHLEATRPRFKKKPLPP